MQAASFIEILVEQIRDEVREEVMQEFASAPQADKTTESFAATRVHAHKASQTELWLSLHLQPRTAPRGAYRAQTTAGSASRPSASPHSAAERKNIAPTEPTAKVERVGSAQTIAQISALEFFRREGAVLDTRFTESEFKKAFRKLALSLHPDRHAQASDEDRENLQRRFSCLVECSNELAVTLSHP